MGDRESHRTLPHKLGIEPGMTVNLLNAPNYFDFDLGELPDDVEVQRDSQTFPADLYLIFADRSDEAGRGFSQAVTYLPPDGAIWFAWPKSSSDEESDLDEDALREMFLPSGMVDDGACSIDETWSAMRFVVADENKADWPASANED